MIHRLRAAGLVASAVGFAAMATAVASGWRWVVRADVRADADVHRWLRPHGTVVSAARALTHLGDPWLVTVAAVGLALLLWRRGRVSAAAYVLVVRVATWAADDLVKLAVDRPRPALPVPFAQAHGGSFPSGHAAGAAALWCSAAVVAGGSRAGKLATALVVPVTVAVTRVALGVHYPTDVVAGLLLGALGASAASVLVDPSARGRGRGVP